MPWVVSRIAVLTWLSETSVPFTKICMSIAVFVADDVNVKFRQLLIWYLPASGTMKVVLLGAIEWRSLSRVDHAIVARDPEIEVPEAKYLAEISSLVGIVC